MSSRSKDACKTGWLCKRGGRVHTWHKRWFVLTGDMLFYYKTPQDTRPTGTIPLAGNNVIRHQDDLRQATYKFEITAGSGRGYITSTHDTYLIGAETAEEADSWVCAIRRVLHEPYGGGMFGRSLKETMAVEARLGGTYIPVLVHRCAKFIREHGLTETGIFRLPGQSSRVQALKNLYDEGSQQDIPASEDVHTVASLLKLYLRELPEPIIPFSLFQTAIKVTRILERDKDEGMREMNDLLALLPLVHFNLLKYLSRFLSEVAMHADVNKMSHSNLATVFGPNLLKSENQTAQDLIECSNASASFVCALIRNQEEYFPFTNNEKPPKRLSVVAPLDILPELHSLKHTTFKTVGSFHNTSDQSPKHHTSRPRMGSFPAKLLPLLTLGEVKGPASGKSRKQVGGFRGSPHTNRKYTFSMFESSSNLGNPSSACGSGRVSPVMISSPSSGQTTPTLMSPTPGLKILPGNEVEAQLVITEDDDVFSQPSMTSPSSTTSSKRYSRIFDDPPDLEIPHTDTVSSEVLVNSIANEIQSLEKQLAIMKEALAKQKRATHMWKSRFEQERRARLAGEERINDLQSLVDRTFQQFALDDSEDEDGEDDFPSDGSNTDLIMENGVEPCLSPQRTHLILSDGASSSQ